MEYTFLIYKLILILVVFTITLLIALYSTYAERKVAAFMQDRLGPDRAGPGGILQPLADGIKMFTKEEIMPNTSDRLLFLLGPVIAMLTALMTSAVIPWGSDLIIGGKHFSLMVANINIAVLYVFGVVSMGVYGILIGGWASNNKFSLIGAIRASSQMISYEIPTLLVILSIIMITGTMNLNTLSEMQTSSIWNWMIFGGPGTGISKYLLIPFMFIGFLVIYISTLAEVNRTPFDIPEAESELVSGYHTEYSGMKFAMFFLSEYANMFIVSAIVVALFLGGYQSPFGYLGNLFHAPWLIPIEQFFWFAFKGIFFVFVQIWLRWTLPRLRVDQLMTVSWKYLIPIAFVNLIIIGLITLL